MKLSKNSRILQKNSRLLQKLKPENSISGISKIFCYPECGQKKGCTKCTCEVKLVLRVQKHKLQQSLSIVIPDLIICGHFDNVLFFVFSLFVVLRWFRNWRFESGPADVEVSSYHVVRHLTVLLGITQRLGGSELTKDALGQCVFTWGRSLLSPLMQVQVARQHVGRVEL